MPRSLRGWLLGSIAIAFVYLLVHTREPLRLNVGDPESDASILTSVHRAASHGLRAALFPAAHDLAPLSAVSYSDVHEPSLPEVFYGAIGKLFGVGTIGTLRLVALLLSALAAWLLFSYLRRLYTDQVAWIATTLATTSMLWMMYADSVHQAPLLQCSSFLALWGVVRAIETKQRRHYAAMIVGSFACFATSFDYYLFLPAAVLFTVSRKAGHPLARGQRHLVALSALGCVLGIVARYLCMIETVGWDALAAAAPRDARSWSAMPTMIRRVTLVFTPLVWITAAYHVIKAVRAPSLGAALQGSVTWMLLAALGLFYVLAPRASSQMIAAQALLPFYAIGSALVLDRLLDGPNSLRQLAFAWLVAAPLWSFYFMFTHPRSLLARDDVARTNAYLGVADHNDFVLSNLVADGPLEAAFQRHRWPALDGGDPSGAPREMMGIFERTGADYVHEIIFTGAASRFVDRALWPLALPRSLWAIAGAPHLHRAKANAVIAEHDGRLMKNLTAVQARKVLQLRNYAIYRVDRAAVLALLGEHVLSTRHVDFGSMNARRHELLGWDGPKLLANGTPASRVGRVPHCQVAPCKTVQTQAGLVVKDEVTTERGLLMIRVERVCDLQLTFAFARPGLVRLSANGFSTSPQVGDRVTFHVPAGHLSLGLNQVALENLFPPVSGVRLHVTALELAPACAGAE